MQNDTKELIERMDRDKAELMALIKQCAERGERAFQATKVELEYLDNKIDRKHDSLEGTINLNHKWLDGKIDRKHDWLDKKIDRLRN